MDAFLPFASTCAHVLSQTAVMATTDPHTAAEPLIIEAAINGATPKRRNPHVPRSTAEVAADGIACFNAGASIVHNHTEDDVLGGPTRHATEPYLESWSEILASRPDALLYPTMPGGGSGLPIADRYAHISDLHQSGMLGLAVADPGSVNLTGMRADHTVSPNAFPYVNSPADIDWMFRWCRENNIPVHVSIFEPGFLRLVLGHLEAGTLPEKVKLQFYFSGPSMLFGLPAAGWALEAYLRLLGDAPLCWMVGVVGGDVVESGLARLAIEAGGHVRVGLEDFAGSRHPANAELVAAVVELAATSGRPVATCEQTRARLERLR